MANNTKSYQVGWSDYYNGQHHNPYVEQSADHRHWYRGWKDAKKVWRATKENR